MTNIGRGIRTYLLTKSSVTDVCSTRIYPRALPQNVTLPAVVYQLIASNSEHHMTDGSQLAFGLLQIDCYATTDIVANNLGEQIRLVLDTYRGAAGSETVRRCHLADKRETYERPADKSDSGIYRVSLDFFIHHTEPLPTA